VTGLRADGSALLAQLAQLGSGDLVSAAELPCLGCHGSDGRGRAEGGVTPSDIRLSSLTRPYEVIEGSGRRRAPYDERKIVRAVAMGLDASGTPLHAVMPRYRLSREDAADLMAYLAVLGNEPDPGLTEHAIRVGALGMGAAGDRDAGAALQALFDKLNRDGGVYRRRVDLVSADLPADPAARAAAVRAFLDRERPFAVIGLVLGRDEAGVASILEAARVPAIAAVAAVRAAEGKYVRALFSAGEPAGMHGVEGAIASAAVLVEGLKRAGRELSREGLLAAMDGGRRRGREALGEPGADQGRTAQTARSSR